MKYLSTICFLVWFGLTSSSYAADYENCLNAYEKKDYVAALKLCRPFAEQGFADAQNRLGEMYYSGLGVAIDYKEAVKWYRLAAEQGHAKAQFNLGLMYEEGKGVAQDYEEALKLYRLAVEQGVVEAQYSITKLEEKMRVYTKASEQIWECTPTVFLEQSCEYQRSSCSPSLVKIVMSDPAKFYFKDNNEEWIGDDLEYFHDKENNKLFAELKYEVDRPMTVNTIIDLENYTYERFVNEILHRKDLCQPMKDRATNGDSKAEESIAKSEGFSALFGLKLGDNVEQHFNLDIINNSRYKNEETIENFYDVWVTGIIKNKNNQIDDYTITIDHKNIIHAISGYKQLNTVENCLERVVPSIVGIFENKHSLYFEYYENYYTDFNIYSNQTFDNSGNVLRIQCNEMINGEIVLMILYQSMELLDEVDKFYNQGF